MSAYESFNYTYNNQGIRIEKVVSHATHKYFVNGTKTLLEELKTNNVKKYFKYKYFGDKLYGFNYNDIDYYYIRNIQGDITSIITKDGTEVARYTYDAWGNHVVSNLTGDNIGDINPFRYRGYYYDKETQLYYLNARYYDPEVGRFISQDNISYLAPETINGLNLYAYCGNNPVMQVDYDGTMPTWLKWTLGITIIVAAVAVSIASAGLLAPVMAPLATALGGGLLGAVVTGAIVGAVGGAVAGFGISIGMQGITNGFDNISWSEVGKATISGAISGFVAGGVFGGIKHIVSASKIANSISGLSKAQENMDKVFKPLSNVKNLSSTFSSGSNIANTVGKVASNFNTAYNSLINAQITNAVAQFIIDKVVYKGAEFILKQVVGYGINQLL